mgnify:CR=1 FL=1|tara:strand:- start:132 stop:917 length:786 start_codon:yes stop_codon:yes gene_type:complete
MDDKKLNSFDILGVKVSAVNMDEGCQAIEDAIAKSNKSYVCVCPVSTIMECQKDQEVLQSVNSANLVTPDGMPVVWLGKSKGYRNISRVYGPDLMLKMCKISEDKGYKNYFYGSKSDVLGKLQEKLKELFPNLYITGTYSPPFRELSGGEDNEIIRMINESNSDILWVGLGSPKQDLWMHKYRDKINVPVMIGVGAAFDFISGAKKQAPKFMQRIGCEWLFRLILEPKRLWRRYIIGNALFLYLIAKGLVTEKLRRCKTHT